MSRATQYAIPSSINVVADHNSSQYLPSLVRNLFSKLYKPSICILPYAFWVLSISSGCTKVKKGTACNSFVVNPSVFSQAGLSLTKYPLLSTIAKRSGQYSKKDVKLVWNTANFSESS